jgi:hypothetical protein
MCDIGGTRATRRHASIERSHVVGAAAALLVLLAAVPAAGSMRPSRNQLISMQQVRPIEITPQSVSVDDNGDASVIVVIGETQIPKPNRFRLTPAKLAHLRNLIASSGIERLHIDAPVPKKQEMYTLIAGDHEDRVVEGHIPRSLRPLIAFLSGLISAHL